MTGQEFNMLEALKDRFIILKANIINSYRIQTAYFFENWASVASTVFYVLTMILFIKIIYANVDTFAGYTENEMLFFILITQANFYADWTWNTPNIGLFIDSVRSGELDLIMSKPMPTLFYLTFRSISLVNRLKDGLINLLLISAMIRWDAISITWSSFLVGTLIFILGQLAWHCFRFLFALPVFFIGQSSEIFQLSGTLGSTNDIPFEGFTGALRNVFTTIIPTLIAAHVSTSVMLGKSDPLQMLAIATTVATVFLLLKQLGWILSIKRYSSASS